MARRNWPIPSSCGSTPVMSNAALERENPELASAVRKLQQFGTPTTPEAAQRALARLTPGERIVFVGVASTHRGAAFAAAEFLKDYLKTHAPFW